MGMVTLGMTCFLTWLKMSEPMLRWGWGSIFPSYGRIQTQIALSLYWKGPEIRPGTETERCSEESSSHGGVDWEVSDFNKRDTQSDKDVTPLWHTLSPRQSEARPGQPPTLPHFLPSCLLPHLPHWCPLPSLCCFVLSPWKIMKASTCNRVSIDVRIHNQQIQKHILGSKWKKGREGEEGSLLLFQWNYERRRVSGAELIC